MFTVILTTIFCTLIIVATTIITFSKISIDNSLKGNTVIKTVLKIGIIFTNLINLAYIISYIMMIAKLQKDQLNGYLSYIDFYGIDYIMFPFILVFFSILLTAILLFYREKKTMYIKSDSPAPINNLCDHCSFGEIMLQPNTPDEDEILMAVKAHPEKIDYVKKLLK